ncbi:MAG: hypothetical protein LC122_02400 [Chitinophagales bacterium]|nr:hypothetical protein [Chitinophagales bacterium]
MNKIILDKAEFLNVGINEYKSIEFKLHGNHDLFCLAYILNNLHITSIYKITFRNKLFFHLIKRIGGVDAFTRTNMIFYSSNEKLVRDKFDLLKDLE